MKQLSEQESIGIFVALSVIVAFFFLSGANPFVQDTGSTRVAPTTATDESVTATDERLVILNSQKNPEAAAEVVRRASGPNGTLLKLVIEDVATGSGRDVKTGDTVTVDYTGSLQNGTTFDSSLDRGQPFTFTVGKGEVIKGWDEGIIGMKKGGERILAIPASKAYGSQGGGPIPPNSSLVFSITLLDIK